MDKQSANSSQLSALDELVNNAVEFDGIVEGGRGHQAKAELAQLRAVVAAAREVVINLPDSELEIARDALGHTNTRIIKDKLEALKAALEGAK